MNPKFDMTYSEMVTHLSKNGQAILDDLTPSKADAWHMATGIAGEAGELLDAIKKYVVYNKDLDRDNVIEELGDLEFYMEGLRQRLNISRQQTLDHNQDKLLTKRYPNGYTDQAAQERNDKKQSIVKCKLNGEFNSGYMCSDWLSNLKQCNRYLHPCNYQIFTDINIK